MKEAGGEGSPVFYSLTEILHSLKSFTANAINKIEVTVGKAVWEKESFDRIIRSEADLQEKLGINSENPLPLRRDAGPQPSIAMPPFTCKVCPVT